MISGKSYKLIIIQQCFTSLRYLQVASNQCLIDEGMLKAILKIVKAVQGKTDFTEIEMVLALELLWLEQGEGAD